MPKIDIIIYHGGPLKNANANNGLPFEGLGIKDDFEERIQRGDFGDFERDIDDNETLDDSELSVDNIISVQNITNSIPAYAPPVLSTTKKLCAKCVDESCKWYVCVVMKPNLHGLWIVTVYVGPHTCIPTRVLNDGRMMTCNFIASDILKKLCEDHTTLIKHLKSMIKSKYQGHKPSYYKVWDAKQKAIGKMFGNWEESYQRL
ncbi:hypothetical protein SO802_032475 [Lithocarpus litseifolius]|uniref:Transposase MuDR plant domain-containing protein n=1 Tax=Lithocarpus litseifolius TaxID=425828 RepID=A0AAW2BFS2_9ROSI